MEKNKILWNEVTLEKLVYLNELGFEFVVEGGEITDVLFAESGC